MATNPIVFEKMRKHFERQGITQNDIANELHTSKQYVSNIMCGRSTIGKVMAKKFEHHFGLSSAWLLTGEGSMYIEPKPYVDEEKEALKAKIAELEKVVDELRVENKKLRERLDLMTDRLLDTYNNK